MAPVPYIIVNLTVWSINTYFVGDNLLKLEKTGTHLFLAAVMLQTGTYKRAIRQVFSMLKCSNYFMLVWLFAITRATIPRL